MTRLLVLVLTLTWLLTSCATLKGGTGGVVKAVENTCKILTNPMRKLDLLVPLADAVDGVCAIPGGMIGGAMEDANVAKDSVTDAVANEPVE